MKSISFKIIGLTLSAILISVIAIGSIGILAIMHESEQDTNNELMLICDNRRKSIDAYLNSIEQSVNMIAHSASQTLDVVELVDGGVAGLPADQLFFPERDWDSPEQQKLDSYLTGYLQSIELGLESVANHTNGSVAYYFRLSPAVSSKATGFLYTKVDRSSYVRIELTDISLYEPDDLLHVGWYYEPIRKARAVWLGPYSNLNLGASMLSYVIPIFKAGSVVGVLGMDISAQTLINQIRDIEFYKSGYAFLVNENAEIIYHPSLPSGTPLGTLDTDLASNFLKDTKRRGDEVSLIEYTYNGVENVAASTILTDGLRLIVTVPKKEINATSYGFANTVVITGILISLIFSFASIVIVRRIIRPLKNLTAVAQLLTKGDYNVDIETEGLAEDEVGILTRSIKYLIDRLKVYISDLNNKAYSDALTHVKNKAGFDIYTRKLNDLIDTADNPPSFAILMADCNDLKGINDTYGHAKGDVYLQNACKTICHIYMHSPVFRLGGDEFAVVLRGQDLDQRDELLANLKATMSTQNNENTPPWECISISVGMTLYDPEIDEDVESVLKRADVLMYEEKRRYKQSKTK